MQIIINIIIFLLTLFIYIHINFHLKTNNDLEILEVEEINKEKLEEICDYKKPLLFNYQIDDLHNNLDLKIIENNYGNFDINIRKISEYDKKETTFLPIKYNECNKLFSKDISKNYISENNQDFLEETTLIRHITSNDLFLRPYMCCEYNHDIIFGSVNSYTPIKYELNYRNYLYVIDGEIELMLTIPNNEKYLDIIKDYEIFEFRSAVNPFKDKNNPKLEKIKFLNIILKKGDIIFIPFKWLYTYKINKKDTIVCLSKYKVLMNTLAIIPQLFYKFMYAQNLKFKFINSIS
tara:strand:- start:1266 stop:2141 length:876 start_codon:yes stop_codon:yes gene_type:complete